MRLDAPHEEGGQSEHDTVSPLLPPPPMTPSPWPSTGSVLPSYPAPPYAPTASMASGYAPMPFQYVNLNESSAGHSGGGSHPSLNNNFSAPQQPPPIGGAMAPTARSEVNSSTSGGSGGSSGSDGRKAKKLQQPSPLIKEVK